MIRTALFSVMATQAGAVDLPAMGPEITACLEQHVAVAPYVAALASAGWSPVRPLDRPAAQRDLSHAMLAALQLDDDHGDHDHDEIQGKTGTIGWAERWDHRDDTLVWIEDASANRTLYERGDAVLLLMGEQITDETAGRIHRTTCLFGAPELDDVARLLAEEATVDDLRSLAFLPEDDGALPYTSVVLTRNVPPPGAEAPTHLDAIITTQVFPVPKVLR
ncbi:hypothetical protein [Jannaschia donghaensis]|uniref:Uncharacterized protein n=1 Tax=Jannaschia donghaensis TaxID=420998 RepID=A0A0M6YFA8_9RHOB|nr:hypothetical protein [Jannaschia donghaensis]CTQ49018.1 hypothetical protein JDO7802_01026 [Jannaschia donghaensis]